MLEIDIGKIQTSGAARRMRCELSIWKCLLQRS